MTRRLASKTCIVTAAGAGIGRASALAFAAEGAKVIAADIDAQALSTLAQEAAQITPLRLDLKDPLAAAQLADCSADVLFNVAGFVHSGTILDATEDEWAFALDLNLMAMARAIRAVLPGMLARGRGTIINMASVASNIRGVPNRAVYSTTKAAVIGLTKAVAADFVGRGIRCNAIAPGTVDTPSLHQRLEASGDYAAAHAAFVARQPMGRLGQAAEVAALATYLASEESAFTTGAVHVIDGGWTM
jgi:2-keto-3-deoxy-L-fuconate dehydrogenase